MGPDAGAEPLPAQPATATRGLAVLGANGRTGRAVVEQARARGWTVLALDERAGAPSRAGVEARTGRLDSAEQLDALVSFGGPIISALGPAPREGGERIGDALDALLPRVPGRRIVWVLGAAVPLPEDDRRLFYFLMTQSLARRGDPVFLEKIRELQLLRYSDAKWTAARPPRLRGGTTAGEYRAGDVPLVLTSSISRGTLARFLLDCVEWDWFVRQAPLVVGSRGRPQTAGSVPSTG
jgi:putative NADH-flavin reductase